MRGMKIVLSRKSKIFGFSMISRGLFKFLFNYFFHYFMYFKGDKLIIILIKTPRFLINGYGLERRF